MISAKVICSSTNHFHFNNEAVTLTFSPDYAEGKNKEWAWATPSLSLTMTVRKEVFDSWGIQAGKTYTLSFEEDSI